MSAAQTLPEISRGSAGLASAAGEVTGRADVQGEGVPVRPRPSGPAHTTIDEIALERRIAGDTTIRLNIAEREEGVRRLHAQGMNDRPVARILGISDRTVLRIRGRLGLPANDLARGYYPHGSLTRYRRGCRCQDCRAGNAAHFREYRRKQAVA